MDTLSKILDLLHFNGTFYYATNFHSPWGIVVPKYKNVARFHYVTQGSCWVKIEGIEEPQLLSSGDLIIISHGTSHVISDKVDRKPVSLEQAFAREGYTGQGVFHIGKGVSLHDTQLICGHFEFKEFFKHPLIDHLPKFIVTNENNGKEFSWLKEILHFMSHTATAQQNGSSAIIKRLSEVIFIQTIRLWYEKSNSSTGFIAALNDKQIAKGLKAFHDNYAENWTVKMLAQQSNMSRSLFSERFKHYLNLTPIQYVTQWRMQNAKQFLKETNIAIENIATTVGYESTASFSKAFKRQFSQNPGEYRRINQ